MRNTFLVARPRVHGQRVPMLAVATLGRTLVGHGRPRLGRDLAVSGRGPPARPAAGPALLGRCRPAARLPHPSLHCCYRCPPCLVL